MSHLILHIGTHKTGTTAIQHAFRHNAARLEAQGVHYPRLHPRHAGHHGLIAEEVQLPPVFHLKGGGLAMLGRLARRYCDTDCTLFLSSEEFSRADERKAVDLRRVADLFAGFDRITVFCALRPQWRFLQAIYLEISRNQSPPRPPDLVAEALETGRCMGLYLDYTQLFDRVEQAFGEGSMLLCDFEQARRQKGGMVAVAQSVAGVPGAIQNAKPKNISPAPLPQWAANLLAEPYPAPPSLVQRTQDALGRYRKAPSTCMLTRDEVARLRDGFAASNAALGQRYPGFALTDPALPPDCLFREDLTLEFWLETGRSLIRPVLTGVAE